MNVSGRIVLNFLLIENMVIKAHAMNHMRIIDFNYLKGYHLLVTMYTTNLCMVRDNIS